MISPPDNLYKFLSFSGLVLFLVAAWLAVGEHRSYSIQVAEMEKANGAGWTISQNDSLSAQVVSPYQSLPRAKYSEQEFLALRAAETKEVVDELVRAEHIGRGMFLIGIGFWYFKIQRYQDRKLRGQNKVS